MSSGMHNWHTGGQAASLSAMSDAAANISTTSYAYVSNLLSAVQEPNLTFTNSGGGSQTNTVVDFQVVEQITSNVSAPVTVAVPTSSLVAVPGGQGLFALPTEHGPHGHHGLALGHVVGTDHGTAPAVLDHATGFADLSHIGDIALGQSFDLSGMLDTVLL